MSAFTGALGAGNTEGGIGTINDNFGSGSLIGGSGFPYEDANAPKAFLNVMFLPDGEAMDLVKDASFAYDQIVNGTTEAVIDGVSTSSFDELRIENFVAPQNGYILVYLSNEGSLNDVYFDDMEITVEEHPVIQKDNYYPFGLTFNSYKRVTAKENRFKYNGFEEQTDLDWNVYDYQARYYDPAIGRFLNVDPAADLMRRHSPYNYAFDNPIRFIDPDGMMPEDMVDPPKWLKDIGKGFSGLGNKYAEVGGKVADFVGDKVGSVINLAKDAYNSAGKGLESAAEAIGFDADAGSGKSLVSKTLNGSQEGVRNGEIEGQINVDAFIDKQASGNKATTLVEVFKASLEPAEMLFESLNSDKPGESLAEQDSIPTGNGTVQLNDDGSRTIFSEVVVGNDTIEVERRTENKLK